MVIGDFGISIEENEILHSEQTGDGRYLSSEALNNKPSKASDIFR